MGDRALVSQRKRRIGARQKVAVPVVDRICRRYLIDLVRVGGNGGPRQPNDVLAEQLHVIVESATTTETRLRLEGSARLATRDTGSGARKDEPKVDDFQLYGSATYDRSKNGFTSFTLIAFSETGHYDEIHKKVLPLGVVFELSTAATPANLAPPSSFADSYFAAPNE